jgi:hypothetical protein
MTEVDFGLANNNINDGIPYHHSHGLDGQGTHGFHPGNQGVWHNPDKPFESGCIHPLPWSNHAPSTGEHPIFNDHNNDSMPLGAHETSHTRTSEGYNGGSVEEVHYDDGTWTKTHRNADGDIMGFENQNGSGWFGRSTHGLPSHNIPSIVF